MNKRGNVMSKTEGEGRSLAERIEAVEEAYEFMLAYAAQGRAGDDDGGPGPGIRGFLERAASALDGLTTDAVWTDAAGGALPDSYDAFREVLAQDAARALAAIRLVLAQPAIGSQLIDNLNASIHLRALLTDLFLLDESLKR